MTEQSVPNMPKVLEAAKLLGEALGLKTYVGDPPPPVAGEDTTTRFQRQQADFDWLTTQRQLVERLQGNYVAIDGRTIVACSPDERAVRAGAAKELGLREEEVLVVPLGVSESDGLWEDLMAKFRKE